jgi:hypothetical protein
MTNKVRNTTAEAEADPMGSVIAPGLLLGPSFAIELSERQGQRQLVESEVLPVDIRRLWPGDGDARALLVSWGFEFGEVVAGDEIFQHANLPPGWSKKGTGHAMWSKIVDERGRERCAIFYKAAFYDRSAHLDVTPRYTSSREAQDESLPVRWKAPMRGVVKEGDRVLFEGAWRSGTDENEHAGYDQAGKDADEWFKANLPNDIGEQWARP